MYLLAQNTVGSPISTSITFENLIKYKSKNIHFDGGEMRKGKVVGGAQMRLCLKTAEPNKRKENSGVVDTYNVVRPQWLHLY